MRIVYRKYLLQMDDRGFAASDFAMVDMRLARLVAQCKIEEFAVPVNNLLRVDLLRRWQRSGRRYGAFVRWLLCSADRTMTFVHSLIFR